MGGHVTNSQNSSGLLFATPQLPGPAGTPAGRKGGQEQKGCPCPAPTPIPGRVLKVPVGVHGLQPPLTTPLLPSPAAEDATSPVPRAALRAAREPR